ncbi:MAG: biotin/lipoyl-binding protein [Gemmatimonadetes bacterium]|nr:biotin/lipoyl-binding protein [Gemmatimonadota bacterium]
MRYYVTIGTRTVEVDLGADGVRVDGEPVDASIERVEGTRVRSLLLDGASHRLVARPLERRVWDLHLRGRRLRAEAVDERTRVIREMTGAAAGPAGPKPVKAPMPGLVVKVEVEEGADVEVGQGLIIVEAMKMENELRAEAAGRVAKVHVAPGEAVEQGQMLMEFEAVEGEDG